MQYSPTIGLEIHAELKTRTKMFCDSLNDPNEKHPNTNVCPVCLGHPGTLPTINKDAVRHVLKVGLALGGKINPVTKFDRKNYFYPDLPKGYQISQYDQPLVLGGTLNGVRITRVHLEEDTGTLIHHDNNDDNDRKNKSHSHGQKSSYSLVDYNRAGTPLMELVTEPDLKSAEEVVAFAKELQLILRYLGVSDADMEKGQMRIEANVSINMGTKTELKNINSFKFAKDAIEYEIKRQIEAMEGGHEIRQETRGWDEAKKKTVSQRSKEEAHDYRYFPEPDLPPFETGAFDLDKLRVEVPELPQAKRARFKEEYGIDEKKAMLLADDQKTAEFFEEYISELQSFLPGAKPGTGVDYILNDLRGLMAESGVNFADLKIEPEHIAHLEALIKKGTIGSRQAKDVLKKMFEIGADPEDIVRDEGLATVKDEGEIKSVIESVIVENPSAVADYKKGKAQALQFLVGKAMSKLKGRGDPGKLKEILEKALTQ
ncbi:MAG: Asp-tRNA(Asn)/Glu-tRNA(Gln) amidotransferase subunit GatB [Patescibacteria group bacterium]